ncbi:MAG: rhamnogalacturonan acetylesterase [Lachnoclostridium sp.]|nr:rhamnogalacturonan acetylesterase [Lachnoclostridium sp.]
MKLFTSILACLFICLSVKAVETTDTITVFMIGDSTMANKPLADENQERGWGQMLPLMLQGAIKVDNHAVNGSSTKSFINEGRWDKVLSLIKPGDYVVIQFGHNDEKIKNAKKYTEPGGSFDDNLRKFVNESRAKGARPILMNSIVRRNFPVDSAAVHVDRDDNPPVGFENVKHNPEGELLIDTHKAYLDAPRRVARELAVPFVEMNTLTHNLVQGLGTVPSRELFMWIPEGKYPFCPKGKVDNTHLNIKGATIVAGIAARAMAEAVPSLRPYIVTEYNYTY